MLAGFTLLVSLLLFAMLIYKVTDLRNGRVYIGQTNGTLAERKSSHYRSARYAQRTGRQRAAFGKALLSAPRECFVWQVIDRAQTQRELDWLEARYVSRLNAGIDGCGYNCREGGGSRGRMSLETRRKQSAVKKGKDFSTPESRAAISLSASTRARPSKITVAVFTEIKESRLSSRKLAALLGVSRGYITLLRRGDFFPASLEVAL